MDGFESTTTVAAAQEGQTLAAVLRAAKPDQSWSQVRRLVESRRVQVDGALCLDSARRLHEGDVVEILYKAVRGYEGLRWEDLVIRHLDEHVVVVEKASGINTVRHPLEREWNDERRVLDPTLEDLTQMAIAKKLQTKKSNLPRLRIVQRLDKETSGLVVFGRSVLAERLLGKQFKAHSVVRRYRAVIRGYLAPQTIRSWMVRDRGDGRRGSGGEEIGKLAVTHIDIFEKLPKHTVLMCQLETGRTHQIRIHLSEMGHPVCGEKVYNRPLDGKAQDDPDDTPRLALHAAELGFQHPETHEQLFWEMELPVDLRGFLQRLRTARTEV